MAIIGEWFRRLSYLLRRQAMDDELRREMEAHRDEMNQAMGEARAFGNTLRLREESRDAWGWRWLDDLRQDTRLAVRTLGKTPGFALTAIATLALGIGVNIGMFTFVNTLLLRPLHEGADEVFAVHGRTTGDPGDPGDPGDVDTLYSYANYIDLREGTADIAHLAAVSTTFVGVDIGEGTRRTLADAVSSTYFPLFDRSLARGRSFTAEEERLGLSSRVAIISYPLWRARGADPGVLGQSVRVDGEPFTVIGVAAEGFTGTAIPGPQVWLPLGPGWRQLYVIGRPRAGTSVEAIATALATIGPRFDQASPLRRGVYTLEMSTPSRLMFMPGPVSKVLTASITAALMIMPAIVLLVACLNLANLLLARGHGRRQELAIRSSVGGGRSRLTRQLLTEGLLLSLAGGAIGLWLASLATGALMATIAPVLPAGLVIPDLTVDWRVLAGTVGFSLAASVLFGAWPAWAVTGRAVAADLKRRSGEEGRRPGGMRIGNALVVGQVALSLLLLASGGLFLMSAIASATADPGFRLEGGLLAEIDPDLAGYDEARGRASHLAVLDRLRTIPGVEAVTIGSSVQFSSTSDSRDVAPVGAADARVRSVGAVFTIVGRDYARTLGLPMLGGRDFTDAELAPGSERVAIVDDALAERLWPGESALGRLIQFLPEGLEAGRAAPPEAAPPIRVIGIIPAVKHSLGNPRPFPHVYVPLGQQYENAMTLQLRLADPTAERAMLATVARAIRSVDERLPVLRVETWRGRIDAGLDVWLYRVGARVFSAFGAIALLLAVVGVYGVKSYTVSRRTREFGIRMAIGARPRVVLWQVLREGGRVTVVGIVVGLALAVAAGRILQSFLYGVDAVEPVVLITAPLVLLASSLLASYIPALRATKVDPTAALRAE